MAAVVTAAASVDAAAEILCSAAADVVAVCVDVAALPVLAVEVAVGSAALDGSVAAQAAADAHLDEIQGKMMLHSIDFLAVFQVQVLKCHD